MNHQTNCEIATNTFNNAADDATIVQAIEESCLVEGLQITLKGSLKQYSGCIHWHLKKGTQRGILEITYWPVEHRIWFKVNARRSAEWIANTSGRLCEAIKRALIAAS